jgi:hypothetical protein
LPAVLQLELSAWQVVPLHLPLQHAALPASLEQLAPSERHCADAQKPLAPQLSEQQSVGEPHGVPCTRHLVMLNPHVFVWVSQTPVQQVMPLVHGELKTPHEIDPSEPGASSITEASGEAEPPVPTEPSAPPPAPPDELPPAPPAETSAFDPSPFDPSPADASRAPPLPVLTPPFPPVPLPIAPEAPAWPAVAVPAPDAPPRPPESTDASLDAPPCPVSSPESLPPQPIPKRTETTPAPTSLLKFMLNPPPRPQRGPEYPAPRDICFADYGAREAQVEFPPPRIISRGENRLLRCRRSRLGWSLLSAWPVARVTTAPSIQTAFLT